jgi:hypothetical protein
MQACIVNMLAGENDCVIALWCGAIERFKRVAAHRACARLGCSTPCNDHAHELFHGHLRSAAFASNATPAAAVW